MPRSMMDNERRNCLMPFKKRFPAVHAVFPAFSFVVLTVIIASSLGSPTASARTHVPEEVLWYELIWNGNKAGHGDVTTTAVKRSATVVVQAVTDGVLKRMLEVWVRIRSTFDIRTLNPAAYHFHLKSNVLTPETVRLEFDPKKGLVTVKKTKGDENESHKEKYSDVYDPVTALYLLRNQPDFRTPMYVDVFDGKDRARLFSTYLRKGPVNVRAGSFDAVGLQLRLRKLTGSKEEIGKAQLWVSDDAHRVPILLTASHLVGTIKLELVRMKKKPRR